MLKSEKRRMANEINSRGQSLIGIMIVLVIVGAISGGFYYFSKQFFETPSIKIEESNPTEEINISEEEPTPSPIPSSTSSPSPTPLITCQDECSPIDSKKCSNNSYRICGNYDNDKCLEWNPATECPSDNICENGICTIKKCTGGILSGQCSSNKPMYCNDDFNLIYKCSRCGCPSNYICQSDETCIQCIEGLCCDIQNKTFRPSSYKCQEKAGSEYSCPWGYTPGSDVAIRYQSKYCSGKSALCNGSLKWEEWIVYTDCLVSEACVKNFCAPYVEFKLAVSKSGTGSGTISSSPSGINCGNDCSKSFASGSSVILTAIPNSGSIFIGWSGTCNGTGNCTIAINDNKTVTANFLIGYSLNISKSGTGSGTITSSPSGINCGTSCSKDFIAGTLITLSASATSGSNFIGWSSPCSGIDKCILVMDSNKSVSAAFDYVGITKYDLSVIKSGTGSGIVTSSPSGISCGTDCTESFALWTAITLTASANSSSVFAGWTGACTGTDKCSLIISSNKSVVAIFNTKTTLPNYTLSVSKSGTGSGMVTSSPTGISCGSDCSETYQSGTSVTLYTTALGDSIFGGWGGACAGTDTNCVLTMDGNKSVKVTFTTP